MADVLVILYVTNVLHVSTARFGTLLAVLFATTLIIYVPAAKAADRIGRRPFIIATLSAFALYPLAIIAAHDFIGLVIAFIVGGLSESSNDKCDHQPDKIMRGDDGQWIERKGAQGCDYERPSSDSIRRLCRRDINDQGCCE